MTNWYFKERKTFGSTQKKQIFTWADCLSRSNYEFSDLTFYFLLSSLVNKYP